MKAKQTTALKGPASPYFTPETFRFLAGLRKNNNKPWFEANRERFEAHVRQPAFRFIHDAGTRLARISKHVVADERPVGGSLFRIYRDIRFSKDKSPYKAFVGIHFWHRECGEQEMAPGFYLHLEPGESRAGSGLWQPSGPTLRQVRQAIMDRPAEWKKVQASQIAIEGSSLQRPPPGVPKDHPHLEDLKRKDFVGTVRFDDKEVASPGFLDAYIDACRSMAPLDAFLCRAMGLPW